MRFSVLLAFLIMAASVGGLIFVGTRENFVYYYYVDEFLNRPTKDRVRLAGFVKAGSINRESQKKLKFTLEHGGKSLPVAYEGIVPDAFKERGQAVVEGRYIQGVFKADQLMAKCPSKFEGKTDVNASKPEAFMYEKKSKR